MRVTGRTRITVAYPRIGVRGSRRPRVPVAAEALVLPVALCHGRMMTRPRIVARVGLVGHGASLRIVAIIGDSALTGNRPGSRLPVAVCVQVGIECVSMLEFAFLLETSLLCQSIPLSGIAVQSFGLGCLALGLCGLHLGVGLGLLCFSLAMLSVRFPGMDLMLGLGGFLTDPCCLVALVFALLGCGLSAECDDDADDNQNYDDRYDYPDDGSCIHAFSPCCLFGSH